MPVENDPLSRVQPAIRQWDLDALQRLATGRGVRIAVIDSQIDGNHPELRGQISVDRNFMPGVRPRGEGHGTEVAGIVAARAHNGLGIIGVAPDARLLGLRACQQVGPSVRSVCDTFSLAKAIQFAIESRAGIINMSLTGPDDRLLSALLGVAIRRDIAVVAAYDRMAADGGFPASRPGVVAVSDELLLTPRAHVYVALGRDIPTTMAGGGWGLVNGSSFAVAHVTGLLALARERRGAAREPITIVASRPDGGTVNPLATLLGTRRSCRPRLCTAGRGDR